APRRSVRDHLRHALPVRRPHGPLRRGRHAARRLRAGLAIVLVLGGCAHAGAPLHPETPAGHCYVLGPHENIDEIARRAGVPVEAILELNGLDRAAVKPGKLIFVLEAPAPEPAPGLAGAPSTAALRWPLEASGLVVASPFGTRGGRAHEGIDLPA